MKEIILEPLKGGYDYDTYSEKYDELLEKTYEKIKILFQIGMVSILAYAIH